MSGYFDQTRRAFITGGAGFIGSHAVERLLAEGHHVTVYDNLSSMNTLFDRQRWIGEREGNPRFRFVEADLRDRETLTGAIAGHDFVWHFGANTDMLSALADPATDLENGLIATVNVLDAMRATGVRDLLFASSGSVYGERIQFPAAESSGPLLPISVYAASKLSAETFISSYCSIFGLRAWMFRFGNVIGGRMGHGVLHDFIQKLRANPDELEVLGDGNQEKNYFLVEDCIDGMLFTYTHMPADEDAPCHVFNLGSDSTSVVKQIARVVSEELGLPNARIRYTGTRRGWPGDQTLVQLNVEKLRRLGWAASRSSDEAVREATRRLVEHAVEEYAVS